MNNKDAQAAPITEVPVVEINAFCKEQNKSAFEIMSDVLGRNNLLSSLFDFLKKANVMPTVNISKVVIAEDFELGDYEHAKRVSTHVRLFLDNIETNAITKPTVDSFEEIKEATKNFLGDDRDAIHYLAHSMVVNRAIRFNLSYLDAKYAQLARANTTSAEGALKHQAATEELFSNSEKALKAYVELLLSNEGVTQEALDKAGDAAYDAYLKAITFINETTNGMEILSKEDLFAMVFNEFKNA